MRSQSTRRLFILSAFLFTIVAISIVGGRAFNGANSRSPQVQAPPAHLSLNKFASGQRRLGGVKAVSPADPNPFRSAFSFNEASGFNSASLFAPNVTAVKSATLQTDVNGNGFVNPGDTLMYSVLVSNTGTDAMNVIFSDQLDANLTLIGTATASPIVLNESYDTIGNTQLQVAGSQTIAAPGLFVNGNVLSNDIDPQGGTLTVTAITNGPTTAGGTVTLNTDGTFIYTPQVGDANVADTFTYTVNEPDGKTGTGTVTINIANARVWYVRNNATAGGLGRSGDPFDTLAEAQTASAANDIIYVFFGSGTTSGQNLGIALKAGQRLIGEGVALTVPVSVNGGPNPTVLRAAGSQPMLDHTTAGGSAVSATDVIPAEIAGLNLAGSANGIDWTTNAAFAGTGTLSIHDNTVRAAGSEGVDINLSGGGATVLGFFENNLTAGSNALDIIEVGAGTLTISAFHDNAVSGNTFLTGITVSTAIFDSVPGGGINPVPGGTTIIGASGNGVGGSGMVLTNVTGELSFANAATGTIGAGDLDIFSESGTALRVAGGAGGFNFSVTPNAGTLVANPGSAAAFSLANIHVQLSSLTSNNSTIDGVSLFNVTGTFSAPSGSSITNATTADFAIDGGTANVTYGGTITDDVGQLVSISGATGGTKSFTGVITDGDDGDGSGISLSSNTGATITFSGGLTLSTGGNPAFAATGGGTVNVCDENPCNPGATGLLVNTLTTTTGTALNVANTNIGANKLEFRSISANGAANGIVLNNTGASGGLTVKGTGSAGSGGTITGSTGTGVLLNTTTDVSLSRMNIQSSGDDGINGTTVTGFSLSDSSVTNNGNSTTDEGIEFTNLLGTNSITNATVTGNAHNNFKLDNFSGTLTSLTITGSSFSSTGAFGNHGFLFDARLTALVSAVNIISSTFSNNFSIGMQVTTGDTATISSFIVSGCTFSDTGTGNTQEISADFATAQMSNMTYKFLNNTITNMNSNAFNTFTGAGAGTGGTLNATIDGNTFGNQAVTDSGSRTGNGMRININGGANARVKVNNNTLRQIPVGRGIEAIARNGTGGANFTITNNTIVAPTGTSGALCGPGVLCPLAPIFVQSNDVTVANNVCSVVSGNTAYDPTSVPGGGGSEYSVYLLESNTSTHNYEGNTGLTALQNLTNANPNCVTKFVSGAVAVVTAGTCVMPPAFAPPVETEEQLKQNSGNTAQQAGGHVTAPGFLAQVRQWLSPIFAAFTASTGYVKLDRAFEKAAETIAPMAAAAELDRYGTGSGSDLVSAAGANPANPLATARGTDSRPAKTMLVNSRGEYRIVPTAALPKLLAGELITINGTGSGFTLPAGESTTVMFNAQISSGYTFPSISNQASVSGMGFGPILSNNLTTDVIQPPFLAKSFSPANIATNGTATLQFALLNQNNTQTLTQVTFTDVLPVGLNVADGTQSACGGTVTRTAATRTIALTGGTLAVGPPCVFNVTVTAGATEGTLTNTTGAPDSLESDAGTVATANVNVINPPSFSKAFGQPTIQLNGTTSLSFTIANNSALFSLNGIGFTDTLPAGLVVATPNGLTGSCGSGTITATQATNTISLSGATLGTGGSCTFSVNVTGTTMGAKPNSATLATTELGANSASTGTVTLNVFAPPTISKAFGAASIPLYTSGSDVSFRTSLTFTINNPAGNPANLTNVSFSDTLPAGLVIGNGPFTASGSCGSSPVPTLSGTVGGNLFSASGMQVAVGSPCTVSLNVRGTTAGTKNNVSGNVTSTEGGTNNGAGGMASASIDVFGPPTIAKAFGASVVSPNTPVTMTFTITNPAGNPGNLTGIAFNDTLMSGLQIAPTPGLVVTNCGSPTTTGFTAGSTSLMVSGATVSTASQCVITVSVIGTTPGTVNNTTTAITSANGGTGATSNTATLIVASPPTVAKAFSPSLITPGGTSTVTITLSNPNAGLNLTGATLTDAFPVGVTTVNSTAATTCAGGTATQMSDSVSLSGGTIPMNGSCTLTVDVTAATNGTYANVISPGNLTTANSGPNTSTANATLTVANPPTISKAFAPNSILSGGTSTLTITLTNPNSNVPLTLSSPLTDTLPVGVTTVAATHANTCGGTSSQTSGSVTLTGGIIPVSGSCTLSVNVTSTNAGGNVNTIAAGALVTNGGSNANPATATLVVGSAPQVDKTFSSTAIKTGATTTLTIAITNNNGSLPFNGVDFTDTLPAGLTVPDQAATPTCGGTLTVASNVITLTGATIAAGANCTVTFTATGATVGVKDNTVTVNTSNFGTGYTDMATVTVYDPPTITKSFTPASVVFGGTSMMSFVLSNPNSFAGGNLSGLSFTDTLPSGITVGNSGPASVCGGTLSTTSPNMVSFSGGTLGTSGPGNACTINVTVTGSQLGMWLNTTSALSSTETGAGATSNTATLTVTKALSMTAIISDLPDPSVTGQSYTVAVTVAATPPGMGIPTGTVNVSDGTGGTCVITLSGGAGSCGLTSTTAGAKTLTASYLGDANFDPSSDTETHQVDKANTALVSLTDSPDPSVTGQAYTAGFTLNVSSPGAGTPTGTVTVNDGTGGMCTATLPATSCSLTSTSIGVKTLTFTYSGDANFNSSTNTAGHLVNKADTTTTITADTPDPSVFGQNYAVTASVTANAPGSGAPTGTITVTDGTNNCTITLPATSCNLPSTSVGPKTLTATYNGDANYNASPPSAGVPHTVNKADTVTTITSDNPDSSAVGQNVTVAFTVAALAPGAGTPTGTVTIAVSGGSETCTGTLAAGSGSCTLALTVPGSRTLTATYNGDTNFNTGTDAEPHTVVAPPSISKAFNPASVPVGQTSTLTFTITNPAANTVALTGVGFTDMFPNAPNLIVANPTGATLTGCGGATLTDNLGGALVPGDLGVMLSGATVGVGGTCTVTINVTPQAQGPFNNVSGNVSSTNGGTGNTATATLLTNTPPTISSNNVPVQAGSNAASFTIATAVDPDQPVNTLGITINGNPTTASANGVTVSNVTITPSGAVTANIATTCAAAAATFNLVVTDNQNATGTGILTVTVTANTPPVLTYNAATVTAGTTPTIPPATGPSDNGMFTIGSVSVSPNNGGLGVLLNQSNGVVTVLNALLIGTYTVTIPIMDNCGATNNAQLIVTVVCPAVTLNPASLPNATVNTAYSQTLSATPAGGNYSFTVTSGSLPAGLTLNSNGSFSGAPTVSGTFNFRVTATGFGGCTAFRDYSLVVVCPTITVNPASLPGGSVGTAYSQTVAGSPAGTYSYSVTSGALPTGLTLNGSTGAITGTPTTTGSFNFTITAAAGSCSGSRTYTVTITCPTITLSPASPLPSGQAGVAYSQTISVSPAGSYTFSLISGSLPSGITLNPATGILGGLPSTVGAFTFTIKAQTAGGCNGTQTYTLAIVCPTVTLSPASLPSGATGTAYSQTISASPAGGSYTYGVTVGSLPTGLNLNSATGVLSGTPAAAGSFTFRVTGTGFGGCTGFRDYTIVIGGGGCPAITLPASLPNGSVGQLYNAAATASPSGGYNYTAAGSLPPGVTLYNSNGLIFGYPTAAGSYTFTITATQGACSGSQTYTVLIGAGMASSLTVFSDFDGDGKSDLSVWRGTDGNWLVANSGDGQVRTTAWGASYAPYNDVTVSGDYDGDGKTDLAVFRRGGAQAGYWHIKQSSDGQVKSHFWGLGTDIPVPGDYDGDGKTDVAVWRGSAGAWYILRSSDGGIEARTWGYAPVGDIPVPGDYDGDSKTDLAVFRRSTGFWYIRRSSDALTISTEWGVGTDVPVPGDYDGDGKTDIAVWRGSESNWYIIESGSALLKTESIGAAALGDVPAVADYDGDGRADLALWRASTGAWTIKRSRDNVEMSKVHGQSGDVPIMSKRN